MGIYRRTEMKETLGNRNLRGGISIDEKIYCFFARYQYKWQKQSSNGRIKTGL